MEVLNWVMCAGCSVALVLNLSILPQVLRMCRPHGTRVLAETLGEYLCSAVGLALLFLVAWLPSRHARGNLDDTLLFPALLLILAPKGYFWLKKWATPR